MKINITKNKLPICNHVFKIYFLFFLATYFVCIVCTNAALASEVCRLSLKRKDLSKTILSTAQNNFQ